MFVSILVRNLSHRPTVYAADFSTFSCSSSDCESYLWYIVPENQKFYGYLRKIDLKNLKETVKVNIALSQMTNIEFFLHGEIQMHMMLK